MCIVAIPLSILALAACLCFCTLFTKLFSASLVTSTFSRASPVRDSLPSEPFELIFFRASSNRKSCVACCSGVSVTEMNERFATGSL